MKRSLLVMIALALILSACSAAKSISPEMDFGGQIEAPSAAPAPAMGMPSQPMEESRQSVTANAYDAAGVSSQAVERLIIQNVDMTIVVATPAQALDAISAMAREMGGFVVTSNIYKTRTTDGLEVPQGSITVRVEAERLDDALARIRSLTGNPEEDVRNETRSGQDVTDQYTDLSSRLANLEQTEAQLREIQASATRTEDVLAVFNQLTQVREQIEVIKGQMKYFEESAALSAIRVEILSQEAVAPLSIGTWRPVGEARDAVQALINALKFLANLLIWVVLFLLPIGLLIGIPLWLIVRALRRSRAKRTLTPPPTAAD